MKTNSFGSTLRTLREREKLSVKEVIDKLKDYNIDIIDKTLYSYENDRRAASADMFLALCQIYNCNNILETFAGIKPDYSIPTDEEWNHIEKYRSLDPLGQFHVDTLLDWEVERSAQARGATEKIEQLQKQLPLRFVPHRFFAYYGKIAAAGTSVEFSGMAAGTKSYPENEINKNADYVIGVNGNSMEPEYSDGDIVYVRKTEHISMGAVGIFQKGNSIYIKKVGEKGLISLNSDYPPLTNDGDAIIVLGEVLGKAEES